MAWTDLSPYTAGRKLTAALLEQLRGNFKALGDPWTAYTPTWTGTSNPTNYTGVGSYIEAGRLVIFRARVTANPASFTAGTGGYKVSLPATIADGLGARFSCAMLDASASQTFIGMTFSVSGTTAFIGYNSSASGLLASVTPTAPFTFAANDYIELTGVYEKA